MKSYKDGDVGPLKVVKVKSGHSFACAMCGQTLNPGDECWYFNSLNGQPCQRIGCHHSEDEMREFVSRTRRASYEKTFRTGPNAAANRRRAGFWIPIWEKWRKI